jgi:hypothetical protein
MSGEVEGAGMMEGRTVWRELQLKRRWSLLEVLPHLEKGSQSLVSSSHRPISEWSLKGTPKLVGKEAWGMDMGASKELVGQILYLFVLSAANCGPKTLNGKILGVFTCFNNFYYSILL